MRNTDPNETTRQVLHAHIFTWSADCDGQYEHGHVMEQSTALLHEAALAENARRDGGWANDFTDLHFKAEVLGYLATFSPEWGPQAIEITEERIFASRKTDEGYSRSEAEWCEEDCATGRRHYRDLRAESMGY